MAQTPPKKWSGCAGRLHSALKPALDAMTVEPAYALYCVVETMSKFLYQAFLLDKFAYADWPHEPPRPGRAGRAAGDDDQRAVQFVAFANSWLITPALFVSVVYTITAISWSDRAGKRRRPLILVPLVGLMFECACATLHAYCWRWPVHWVLVTYGLAQVAFGGRICFSQSAYLYLADVTTKENRTARYGVLMTVRYFSMPLGYAIGGLLLQRVGFFYSFLTCFAISVTATFFAWLLVADVSVQPRPKLRFWQAVSPKSSVQSVNVLLKKRPQNTRAILAMMLLAFSLFTVTNEGELSVMYLYLSHQFRWNESQIGMYLTYRMFIIGVGTLVCSVILSKYLKMEDGSIGIFIGVAKTTAAVAYTLTCIDWQLYAIPLIDMYFAAGITVTRSFATKLVTSDELGRLAAVCSLTKISVPLSQPLYNMTYAFTMSSSPSAFFFVSLFFALIILLLTGVSQKLYRKQNSKILEEVLLS